MVKFICVVLANVVLLVCNGQNNIYGKCTINTENVTQEEYDEAVKVWRDCLATERLREKSKAELYKDIRGDSIEGEYSFLEEKMSDEYISYKALSKILTDEELKENLKQNDAGIKYYSFLAIVERENEDIFEMLKSFIADTATVSSKITCGQTETTLVDLCINIVTEKYFVYLPHPNYKPKNYQLTLAEKAELDELVLNNDLDLNYKEKLLKAEITE